MGDLGTTSGFYSARPALSLEGRVDDGLTQGLLALSVSEDTEGLFRCEACFGNWGSTSGEPGFLYFDRQGLDFGRRLAVEVGSGGSAAQVFDGRITALEGRFPQKRPPEIQVLAEDRFQDLRMTRRSRTFEEVSDRDVIEEVAGHHGLGTDLDLDGPTYRVLAQVNQSDLAFLRERARAVDAELWLDGDVLHAQARARRNRGEVTLTYGKGLHEFAVCADLAHQRTTLTVGGWDVAAKEGIVHEAGADALAAEVNDGDSGPRLLEAAFGRRPEQLVHLVPLSSQEARALAEAHYRGLSRRFVSGRGVAEGDGRLRVGGRVTLAGLGPLFDGAYYLCEVRHTFDPQNGLRTAFRVERPWLGGAG